MSTPLHSPLLRPSVTHEVLLFTHIDLMNLDVGRQYIPMNNVIIAHLVLRMSMAMSRR